MSSENEKAKAQAMGIEAEAREAADNYARMEYAEPSRPRVCWGMYMPDIDEPTGAALHLLGAVATLDYQRLVTEGTATSGGIEGAMDHIESAVDILWPERDEQPDREDEDIDTLEATDQLTNAMLKRASEFPIASREDAIDALMDAAAGTAALVGALLALADNVDDKAGAALLKCSKEAGNANMQTMRAIGYLNKCNAKSGEEA